MHSIIATLLLLCIDSARSSLLPDIFAYPSYKMQFKQGHQLESSASNSVQFKLKDQLLQCTFQDQIKQTTIDELENTSAIMSLEPMKTHCLYKIIGWWTYEVCPGKHVRQYHQMDEQEHKEFTLMNHKQQQQRMNEIDFKLSVNTNQKEIGYNKNVEEIRLVVLDHEMVVKEVNSGGSVCTLTNKPRSTEIQYKCTPQGSTYDEYVESINEIGTCKYQVVIYTKKLCKLPLFSNSADRNDINCSYLSESSSDQQTNSKLSFVPAFKRGKNAMANQAVTHSSPKVTIKKVMLDDENKEDVNELIRSTLAALKKKKIVDGHGTAGDDEDDLTEYEIEYIH